MTRPWLRVERPDVGGGSHLQMKLSSRQEAAHTAVFRIRTDPRIELRILLRVQCVGCSHPIKDETSETSAIGDYIITNNAAPPSPAQAVSDSILRNEDIRIMNVRARDPSLRRSERGCRALSRSRAET